MKDLSIKLKYEFESYFGPMAGERYIREFKVGIYAENEEKKETEKLIGKFLFKIVYIDEAENNGYDLFEIFDTYGYTFRLAEMFFDFDSGELKEDIQEFYNYDLIESNICILEKIEILPDYRGHKIAAKVIKDIIFHFGAECGLFIIQAYPLQFESAGIEKSQWQTQLELNKFPVDEITAFNKLKNYYISIGFDKIPGYKDLLFYNPALKNKKFDAIDLEE